MATVSPGDRAVAVRACRATPAGQARRADWVRGRASGRRTRLCWERVTYSANPPSRAWPMPCPRRQRCWRPARQRSQRPQALVSSATTRSPGWTRWTPGAVSSTMPAISWPRVMPGWTPRRRTPAITRRSWWQKPQAATRTRASPGAGMGLGRSATVSWGGLPGGCSISARMVGYCIPVWGGVGRGFAGLMVGGVLLAHSGLGVGDVCGGGYCAGVRSWRPR